MKKAIIATTFVVFVVSSGLFYWYFFGKTLRLTEIIEPQQNAYSEIALKLFDFDTGLTRYDIYTIERKVKPWQRRYQWINSLQDPKQRDLELNKLLLEISQDPVAAKFMARLSPLGPNGAFEALKGLR